MSDKEEVEEQQVDSGQSSQPEGKVENDPWGAILSEESGTTPSIPDFLKAGITKSPILSKLEDKRQKQLDEDLGDDPLIKMSRQISSMSKEIETLLHNLYNTTELLQQRELELYNLRKKNFVKSNLFHNFVMNNDPRRRAFFFWKNRADEIKKEQEDLQNRLQSMIGEQQEESNKNLLIFSQAENERLHKQLLFAKVFFRWRINLEIHAHTEAERKHMEERLQIMKHLQEIREQMTMANDLEAKYVHMSLRRGKDMFNGIKEAYEEALLTQKWQEEYVRKVLSGEVDLKKDLEAALNENLKDVNKQSNNVSDSSEEVQIDLSK